MQMCHMKLRWGKYIYNMKFPDSTYPIQIGLKLNCCKAYCATKDIVVLGVKYYAPMANATLSTSAVLSNILKLINHFHSTLRV